MSKYTKRRKFFALNSKTSAIKTFDVGADIPANCIVMLDPADPDCGTVIEWDGADECDALGIIRCPIITKAGKCAPIQVYDDFQLVKCAAGGGGGEIDTMDTEVECFCDETKTEFLGFFTVDHDDLGAPPTVSYTLADGTPYVPVGEIQKVAGKSKPAKVVSPIEGKQMITSDGTSPVSFTPPANAVGAFVTIKTTCCAFVCWDGSAPDKNSPEVGNNETICLGCTPGSGLNGAIEEVANFQMIADEDCIAVATAIFYE